MFRSPTFVLIAFTHFLWWFYFKTEIKSYGNRLPHPPTTHLESFNARYVLRSTAGRDVFSFGETCKRETATLTDFRYFDGRPSRQMPTDISDKTNDSVLYSLTTTSIPTDTEQRFILLQTLPKTRVFPSMPFGLYY